MRRFIFSFCALLAYFGKSLILYDAIIKRATFKTLLVLALSECNGSFNAVVQVDIAIPEVFIGGLLGSMLIFLFSAWACVAVGRTAQEVVNEVRRQFIERPGIMVSFTVLFLEAEAETVYSYWL